MYLEIKCDQEIESLNIVFGPGKSTTMDFKEPNVLKTEKAGSAETKSQKSKPREEFLSFEGYDADITSKKAEDEIIEKPVVDISNRAPKVAATVSEAAY